MNRLPARIVIVIALWCAALLSALFWLNVGRITPITGTQLIATGSICEDIVCTEATPITLPWFSKVEPSADITSVGLVFHFALPSPPDQPQALYFPKFADNLSLRLNGIDIRQMDTSQRLWNTPLLVPVNSTAFSTSQNELEVEISGRLSEGLGLQPFYVGPETLLYPPWALRTYLGPELARLAMALMIVLGVALLAFWTTQRNERTFLWLGLSCLCACVFLAHYGLRTTFLSYKIWTGLWVLTIGLYVFLIMQFEIALLRLSSPRLTRAFAITLGTGAAAVTIAPADYTFHIGFAFNLAATVFAFTVLCSIYKHRDLIGKIDFTIFFVCLSFATVLGLNGLIYHLAPSPPRTMPLFHVMPIIMVFSCLWLILGRAIQAIRSQAIMVADQSRIIAEKSAELHDSFARLAEVDRTQAVAKERARITSDLHDGIGSHLVSTLSYIRDQDIEDRTLITALEDALRELSLLVDSVGNDGDVVSLLGMLRLRLEGLLAQNGLQFDWQIESDPKVDHLDGVASLHIARIVQEAISNAIKHSGASTITVHANTTSISVTDNGRGFDVDEAKTVGFGLGSMQQRAQQIGAELKIGATSEGTSVTLCLLPKPRSD